MSIAQKTHKPNKPNKSYKPSESYLTGENSTANIYNKVLLQEKISVDFSDVNREIKELLQKKIVEKNEGICINEGYIKIGSVKVISMSAGELNSNKVIFDIVYECLVTNPVESMTFDCIVKSITKVGIRAELNENISPYIIFIARDHHYDNEEFSKINEGDVITVKVLGQRFELNDTFISVIAELESINNKETTKMQLQK